MAKLPRRVSDNSISRRGTKFKFCLKSFFGKNRNFYCLVVFLIIFLEFSVILSNLRKTHVKIKFFIWFIVFFYFSPGEFAFSQGNSSSLKVLQEFSWPILFRVFQRPVTSFENATFSWDIKTYVLSFRANLKIFTTRYLLYFLYFDKNWIFLWTFLKLWIFPLADFVQKSTLRTNYYI